MSDSEKSLKIISIVVSGFLVAVAMLFLVFGQGEPVEAEAVMEYSAPADFDPSELTSALYELRKDQAFLREVAVRSGFAKLSDPELDQEAASLADRMAFEPNRRKASIAIRFTHRTPATAVNVANVIAAVAKENLEARKQSLAMEILCQEDAVEDKRKLLVQARQIETLPAGDPRKKSAWGPGYSHQVDPQHDYECSLRKLEELKAKPVFSLGAIRPATQPID